MMFNQYPYMNINDLNLDYILNQMKTLDNEVTNFVSLNAIKYADPIQWNITRQYEKNTIVIDPLTGTAYISVAPVPSGVALTREEYWSVVFDLSQFIVRAAQNFTSRYETATTLTATFPTPIGGWLVWNDILYKALVNITAGDQYVVGSNIEHFTIEDLYNAYLNTIALILEIVGELTDLNTADKTSIVNAINSVIAMIDTILGFANESKNENFSQAYTSGTIIMWYDRLFSVNNNVNAGDPISGNVTPTDLAGIITDIYNEIGARVNEIVARIAVILGFPNESENENFSQAYTSGTIILWYGRLFSVNNDVNAGDPISGNVTANDLAGIITDIYTAIDNVKPAKDIIILASSVGTTPSASDNFIVYIEPLLKPTYRNVYHSAYSGAGFVYYDYYTYLQMLENIVVDDEDAIADIVVVGIGNDINISSADLFDAVSAFVTYAKGRFKNAQVHIAPSSSNQNFADHKGLVRMYIEYMKRSGDLNYFVVPYSFNLTATSYPQFVAPNKHPTTAGAKFIAFALANSLLYGSWQYEQSIPVTPSSLWLPTNATIDSGYANVYTDRDGMHCRFKLTFTPTANINVYSNLNTPFHILNTSDFASSIIDPTFAYYAVASNELKDVVIEDTNGNYFHALGGFFYDSNNDRFTFAILSGASTAIQLQSGTQYNLYLNDTFSYYAF